MRLTELLNKDEVTISCELFPPKQGAQLENYKNIVKDMAALKPAYMSVTYGATGGTSDYTVKLAEEVRNNNIPALAHLTCASSTREKVASVIEELKAANIENILALRGDLPNNFEGEVFTDFAHASELVAFIKENGDFCVGGACYPEVHPDSPTKADDLEGLKRKVEAGCEYLTTQMFFDNNIFFNFMYRVREAGITVPIIPGIMPITRRAQVKNAVKLSGCNVPERFKNIVDRFGDSEEAMKQAGIAYATDQIIDLMANGVRHIHVYSMNKPEIAAGIQKNLSEILKA